MSRQHKTETDYLKNAKKRIKLALKESKIQKHKVSNQIVLHQILDEDFMGLSLLNTCIWAKLNWNEKYRSSSWRMFRNSLKFLATKYFEIEKITKKEHEKIIVILDNIKGGKKEDLPLRTSAKKMKHISIKDLKILDNQLKKSKNKWSGPTRLWIRAGILTGLRPIEWKTIIINEENETVSLIVKNAKHTNDRAHGEIRTLNLNHLKLNEIGLVKQHIQVSSQMSMDDEIWEKYYQGCSNLLRYLSRKVWPNRKKHHSLYSARHQFSANLKASGCLPVELAALMGHASDLTALTTYGRKVNGTKGRKPEVNKNEIKNIRSKSNENKFSFNILRNKVS
jgi:integrase